MTLEKYHASITPKNSLMNVVDRVVIGKGKEIEIGGRKYFFREKGLTQSPFKDNPLDKLKKSVENTNKRQAVNKTFLIPDYIIHFSLANRPEDVKEDKGEIGYEFVESNRYKVFELGYPGDVMTSTKEMINKGRGLIESYFNEKNHMPKKAFIYLAKKGNDISEYQIIGNKFK